MVDFSKYNEQELSFLLKSEDKKIAKAAFDVIYNKYASRLYTFCYRFLRDKDIAQDIFQDVFIKFFNSVQNKANLDNIGGYLQRIARNLCINALKDPRKNSIQFEKSKLVFQEHTLETKQEREIIEQALSQLPDHYREIIILKEFLNLSYDEIADSMDVNRNSVGVTLHRAKQKLKELLQPYLHELLITEGEKHES